MHPVELAALICLVVGLGGFVIFMLVIYRAYTRSGDSDHG